MTKETVIKLKFGTRRISQVREVVNIGGFTVCDSPSLCLRAKYGRFGW